MKTIKNHWKTGFILSLFILSMGGCSKEGEPEPRTSNKLITGFVFLMADNAFLNEDVAATINEGSKTIIAEFPGDTPLKALTPTIALSDLSAISPAGTQDFTHPVTYTVTAEDGSQVTYRATAISKSSEKRITSFAFLLSKNPIDVNVLCTVNEENKTITAIMPPGAKVNALLPDIEVSVRATVNPTTIQDFTNPVNYTVTAEDGSIAVYTVALTASVSQLQVLRDLKDINPGNSLGWDLSGNTNLAGLSGVSIDDDGFIVELNLFNKNLIRLPPEIGQLTRLRKLNVGSNQLIFLPPEIGQLINLEEASFYLNQLHSVPKTIGRLIKLKELNLSRNQLTTVPAEIGLLTKLEFLALDENEFQSIPACICQLEEFNNPSMLFEKNDSDVCSTTSPMDALISIYTANPGNTLGWSVDNYPGVKFQSGVARTIEIENKGIQRITSGVASITPLRLLDVRNNPLGFVAPEVCKLKTRLTILSDPGEGCN